MELYFFIADISGYTSFMIQNQTDYDHGTLLISDLMQSLVDEVKLPMKIAKLEGDALFFTVACESLTKEDLGRKLLRFFDVFFEKLSHLKRSITCRCGGCANLDRLELKIIGHYGKAEIARIGAFEELSGVDVILAHRLLKNSLREKTYFLMTSRAFEKISIPANLRLAERKEIDPDFGEIPIFVCYPERIGIRAGKSSFIERKMTEGKLIAFNLLTKLGLKKRKIFENVPGKFSCGKTR